MTKFRVTFEVDWSDLPRLINATELFEEPKVEVLAEKPKAAKAKKPRERKPVSQTPLGMLILDLMSDGQVWTLDMFTEPLERVDYAAASASGTCTHLMQEGLLERIRKGAYRLAAGSTSDQAAAAA